MHTQFECLKLADWTKSRSVSKNHLCDDGLDNEDKLLNKAAKWCLPTLSLPPPSFPSPSHNHGFEAKEN